MRLIFVYNSDGNLFALAGDTVRKLVSPKTYPCNLCKITYPTILMDSEWKKFIASLPYQTIFLHRDEFQKQYPNQKDIPLPALFKEDGAGISLLIPRDEINKAHNVQDLIKIVNHFLPK